VLLAEELQERTPRRAIGRNGKRSLTQKGPKKWAFELDSTVNCSKNCKQQIN
jgi:hypothetical protein